VLKPTKFNTVKPASQSTDLEFNEQVGQLKELKFSAVELVGLLGQAAA